MATGFCPVMVDVDNDVFVRFDRHARICVASESVAKLIPLPPSEILGKKLGELGLPPDRCAWWESRIQEVLETGLPTEQGAEYGTRDGGLLDWRLLPERSVSGEVVTVLAIARDVTAHRNAERDFRLLFDQMTSGFALHEIILDGQGKPADYRFRAVNQAFERLTGLTAGQVVGRRVLEVLPDTEHSWIDTYGRVALTGEPVRFEAYSRTLDRHFEVAAYRPAPGQFACIFADITERRRTVERLQESEERYRTVFGAAWDAMFLLDGETGRVLDANAAAESLYGYRRDEFLRLRNVDLSAEPAQTHAALVARTRHTRIRQHRKKDGTVFPVELTANYYEERGRVLSVVNIRDITARVNAEQAREQLRHAQKMEAVGQLARGIAQDFRSLLSTIENRVDLMLETVPDSPELRDDMLEIRHATDRAVSLTRQLLAFTQRQAVNPKRVEINEVLQNLCRMLGRVLGNQVSLSLELAPDAGAVFIDPLQFSQLVVNLAINARDAMPHGGELAIKTAAVHGREEETGTRPGPGSGRHVELELSDTGMGIAPALLPRIFEPFFTTKPRGSGAGLGLSTVYGIVKPCGGHIDVRSELGCGTTFRIVLPACDQRQACRPGFISDAEPADEGRLVLLVEDQDDIRRQTARTLIEAGFRVIETKDAQEALVRLFEPSEAFSLLLCDVVLPGMSGVDLAEYVLASHPHVKVLFMSGYSPSLATPEEGFDPGPNLLAKPFGRVELLGKVAALLGSPMEGQSALHGIE